jgi:SOS response regulatory protein OraA/RecX
VPEPPPRHRSPADVAAGALARRDRSEAELSAYLEQRGLPEAERAQALETMQSLGYQSDVRFAHDRARILAERGRGDEAIRWDLEQRGLCREHVDAALSGLAPEHERAAALVERLGRGPKAARALAEKGFSEDSIEFAVGDL